MELLIPGLILVALMAYVSTRIKKRAAAAFEPETVDTGNFSIFKPEGFLHVIGDPDHEFSAYSKEFGDGDDGRIRRATIDVDVIRGTDLRSACEAIAGSAEIDESDRSCTIEIDESANDSQIKGVYKIVSSEGGVYRLRFAVLAKHYEEYARKIDETLESFRIKTN